MAKITDKTVKSKYPPKQTNVTWIDTSQKPAVTKSYIDGQWVVVGGGVTDYNDIKNKPTINGVELDGNKTSQDLGVYSKPSSGIPQSDLSSDVQSQLNKHFKGWYASVGYLETEYPSPVVGDYAYVKGAESTDPAAIYECTTAGTWSDSGRTADTSNVQTFASGEEVNEISIDNDFAGGSNKIAGAEEVKDLNIQLYGVEGSTIDLSNIATHPGYIYDGKYRTTSSYQYKIIPAEVGRIIKITANSNYGAKYAFLKSYPDSITHNVTPVDFCDDTDVYGDATAGKSIEKVIPNDCVYLYVLSVSSNTNTEPSSVEYVAVEGDLQRIESNIVDISAETGNTYTSLSEALVVADSIIPSIMKKGGMSVKFIQFNPALYNVVKTEGVTDQPSTGTEIQEALSLETGTYTADQIGNIELPSKLSTSKTYYLSVSGDTTTYNVWFISKISNDSQKYVQYRLLNLSWSTNVSDWQGVADKIISNNKDLARSGDVFTYISKLMPEYIIAYNNNDLYRGGYYTYTGYVINGNFSSKKIDIPQEAKYIILQGYRDNPTYEGLLFYDSNDQVITGSFVSATTELKNVKIPEGVIKVAINAIFNTYDNKIRVTFMKTPLFTENDGVDEKIANERINNIGVSINVFGDVLPPQFKTKLVETNDDLLIACQGDSITGLTQQCNPSPDVTHDCPGGQYQSFVYLLQKNVGKVKPFYNRLDSQRNNADFFTKTGTWEQTGSYSEIQGIPSKYQEASVTCLTYRSNSVGASIAFSFDADSYEKCNIIFAMCIDGGDAILNVQQGNGKLLASIDRTTWVEANGFTHSQELDERPTDTAGALAYDHTGEALCQRHRRLWIKKVDSTVTGTLNLTYSKVGSDSNYVYCWGTEMYSGRGIFFDNIGRGGKSISALKMSISDIFDRNPDLTILEIPLGNDTHYTTTNAELLGDDYYIGYFLDETYGTSYRVRSEEYTKCPIIIVLPHTRHQAFDENDNAILYPEGFLRTAPAYDLYKMVWAYLRTNLKSYDNVRFVNLCDQFLNEAKYRYGSYYNGISDGCMTYDTIHLNQRGADIYNKYLAPIFQ